MKGFIAILQFTTRLPVYRGSLTREKDLISGIKLLPLAGCIIGAVMWLVYRLLHGFDPFSAAVAAVLAEGLITGGLHYDGLADTFDGLCSGKDAEGMLEIMKDSRLGTHGVLALTGALLLKAALVNALGRPEALFAMPVFSRLAMVYGAAFSKSARQTGLGYVFIKGTTGKDALFASLITAAAAFYPIGIAAAVAAVTVTIGGSLVFVRYCSRKIGGMTGDTLGALGELVSLGLLAVYCIMFYLV
jgi:adenosylcobinamide-GDP ribazoletransferase